MNYQDVKNAINARINKLARKDAKDEISCKLWLEYLKHEKNYLTFFKIHDNGPALVSWILPGKKMEV